MKIDKTAQAAQFDRILHEAFAAAKIAVAGQPDTGACGFAWVVIDGNHPLARHCRSKLTNENRAFYGSKGYPRGHQWWNPSRFPGQSVDAIERGAVAFRDVLGKYNIVATTSSRLD